MNRRRVLSTGIGLGGVGALIGDSGCAHNDAPVRKAEVNLDGVDDATVQEILKKMERRLAWIDRQGLPPDLVSPERSAQLEADDKAKAQGRLFRQNMRSLYVAGRFLDMPPEMQAHPDVQEMLWSTQTDLNEAVLGTTEMLASLNDDQVRRIQAVLRKNPELPERLAMLADEPAREDGILLTRRLKLRAGVLDLGKRMRDQSPSLVIDPLVNKSQRIVDRPESVGSSQRMLAARVGEQAFWEHQDLLRKYSEAWSKRIAANGPTLQVLPPEEPSKGRRVLGVGGHMMGYGLASVGVGLIFAGLYNLAEVEAFHVLALVFGVTVGPILLTVGALVALVGAIAVAGE